MTKKHFVAAANIVSEIRDRDERTVVARNFADFFVQFNDRFNRDKFLEACNVID